MNKSIGSILMILGTSIGAGMLALPLAASSQSLIVSLSMLGLSWLVMTLGAFLILEVNLCMPEKSNLISMAQRTLGYPGQVVAWVTYLLLLYALLCAYIASSSDIVDALFLALHLHPPHWLNALIVVVVLGGIVYRGIYSVDVVNRGLMFGKLSIFLLLIFFIAPHIQSHHLLYHSSAVHISTLMVMITSFGFAIIVPSLRTYFNSDVKALKKVIFIGSILPLIIYTIWIFLIQGLVPRFGPTGLIKLSHAEQPITLMMHAINTGLQNWHLTIFANVFIAICAITSFLGVSLCLTDFIADGLQLEKKRLQGLAIITLAFVPPFVITVFFPGLFIRALSYAGALCVILLILLPIFMAYSRRYWKKLESPIKVIGGRGILIATVLLVAVIAAATL